MNDAEGAEDVGRELSDAWLESLIRHLRGWPPGTPVPPALLASWRRHLRAEVRRVRSAQKAGQDPYPAEHDRPFGMVSADDLVIDMLRSPEGQLAVSLAVTWSAMVSRLAELTVDQVVAGWRRDAAGKRAVAEQGQALARYIDLKLTNGAIVPAAGPPYASERAGVNAVTPDRARAWLRSLSEPRRVPGVLVEARRIGAEASAAAAPLELWRHEPGLPRGLWPDPPPVLVAAVQAGADAPALAPAPTDTGR